MIQAGRQDHAAPGDLIGPQPFPSPHYLSKSLSNTLSPGRGTLTTEMEARAPKANPSILPFHQCSALLTLISTLVRTLTLEGQKLSVLPTPNLKPRVLELCKVGVISGSH